MKCKAFAESFIVYSMNETMRFASNESTVHSMYIYIYIYIYIGFCSIFFVLFNIFPRTYYIYLFTGVHIMKCYLDKESNNVL